MEAYKIIKNDKDNNIKIRSEFEIDLKKVVEGITSYTYDISIEEYRKFTSYHSEELEKEINGKKIEAMEDGFAKELALIDEQERQKLAELENKKITPEEIAKLQEITAKATGTDKEFFDSLLKQWKANNEKLETAKAVEINYFNDRRKALGIKYKNEELAEANKAYEEELKQNI